MVSYAGSPPFLGDGVSTVRSPAAARLFLVADPPALTKFSRIIDPSSRRYQTALFVAYGDNLHCPPAVPLVVY